MAASPHDELLAEQIAYYRARAPEYDGAYQHLERAYATVDLVLDLLEPAGSVLELACGTGMWTRALAQRCAAVTALDAAPEALDIARRRCPPSVHFETADVFGWAPRHQYDTVFTGHFLSHVPDSRLAQLSASVSSALRPGGRFLVVDEGSETDREERRIDDDPEVAVRTIADGREFRMVKVFLEPGAFAVRMAQLGWTVALTDSSGLPSAGLEFTDRWLVATLTR